MLFRIIPQSKPERRERSRSTRTSSNGLEQFRLRLLLIIAAAIIGSAGFIDSFAAQSGRRPPPEQQNPADQRGPSQTRPRTVTTGQDDKPIKLSADLVTVITSVTDTMGNQVNDLTEADFVVYEDTVPQPIAGFYREGEMPLRMVFLFDTSTSIRHRFDFEFRAAARFFRYLMRPQDKAGIISISTEPKIESQFTSDVDSLIRTLEGLKPEGATALYQSMIDAARYLRPAEGRHVMVVLSDGTDTASGFTLAQALAEVQQSDAVIYAVHSTGVAPSANVQDLAGEFVLKAMSEDTGGRAFFPPIQQDPKKEARELDEIYRQVAAEVRAQYVLTYYSTADARPGVFRSIHVEAKRPGLRVRARRGYYTSRP